MQTVVAIPRSRRAAVRFLSTDFHQPVGRYVDPTRPRGYHVDLRVKAREPSWPPPWLTPERLYAVRAQHGLGAFERWVAGEGEAWLELARRVGEHLLDEQRADGGWAHRAPMTHTFALAPGWLSGMAQGQGSSLLVRLHLEDGAERWADGALRALEPLRRPVAGGGVQAALLGRPFPEEYPTDPPSYVLNGAIYAMWGMYDVASGLDDARARTEFADGACLLGDAIDRWDTGWWSRYDLFPHPVVNVASLGYHRLHVDQLTATLRLTEHPALQAARDRFAAYARSQLGRARALAAKLAFRALVPRRRSP